MSKVAPLLRRLAQIITQLNQRSPAWALLIIFSASFAVKFGYILTIGGGLDTWPPEGSDSEFYQRMAVAIWRYGFYGYNANSLTTAMPPGQSVFFALVYATFGPSYAAAKLAQVVVITLAAGLTYFTGRLIFPPAAAFLGALLLAIDPAQAYLSATFLSDGLFIFLMALGLYALTRSVVLPKQPWLWWVSSGLCFGLAGLVRNQGWLFALALLGLALLTRGRWVNARAALVTVVTTLLVIAPWTLRNYWVSGGHFIPVSTEGGLTLWSSNNPSFNWRQPMPMSLPVYASPSDLSEVERDQYYRNRAIDWIIQNPLRFLTIGFQKVIMLYHFDPASNRATMRLPFLLAGLLPYGLMLPWIVLGVIKYGPQRKTWIIMAYLFFTTALTFVFFGDSRLRAPIQPYLYLLGAAWLCAKISRFQAAPMSSIES